MFRQAATPARAFILRGLVILLAIVTVGVSIVDYQVAAMTQRPIHQHYAAALITSIAAYTAPLLCQLEDDIPQLTYWLTTWQQQFAQEALAVKQTAAAYWQQLKPGITVLMQKLQHLIWQIIRQLETTLAKLGDYR